MTPAEKAAATLDAAERVRVAVAGTDPERARQARRAQLARLGERLDRDLDRHSEE